MDNKTFIKKHKLTQKSVPKLYNWYLTLMSKGDLENAFKLSEIINILDKKHILNK
jgi:hypothetical protein